MQVEAGTGVQWCRSETTGRREGEKGRTTGILQLAFDI